MIFQTNIDAIKLNPTDNRVFKRNISFGSKKIYDLEIFKLNRKGQYELVPAAFTRLINSSEEDKIALDSIKKSWKKCDFLSAIVEKFSLTKNPYIHYAVEIKDDKLPLKKRILAVACILNPRISKSNELKLCWIQGKHNSMYGTKKRQYKGAGELMMYGLTKMAKSANMEKLSLLSSNDSFYDAINMRNKINTISSEWFNNDVLRERYFLSEDFNTFLKKMAEKYKLF